MSETGTNTISVSVTLTFRVYLYLNACIVFRQIRVAAVLGVFFIVLYVVGPFVLSAEDTSVATKYLYMLPALFIPALVFVFAPIATFIAAQRRWHAAAELREPMTYCFSEAGIRMTGTTYDGFTSWSNIKTVERIGSIIFLATGQQFFYVIPIQSFGGDEALTEFTNLVRTKVSKCNL